MYTNILIPVALDHEALVEQKLDVARKLLAGGGKITLLTVLENIPGFVSEFVTVKSPNNLTDRVRERLEAVAAGAADIECAVVAGKPGVMIAEYAEDKKADLIVVGSHAPGIEDYFLGSTASRVVRRAPCSVFVLR